MLRIKTMLDMWPGYSEKNCLHLYKGDAPNPPKHVAKANKQLTRYLWSHPDVAENRNLIPSSLGIV